MLKERTCGRCQFGVAPGKDAKTALRCRARQHPRLYARTPRALPDFTVSAATPIPAATMLMTVDEKVTSNAGEGFSPTDSKAALASARDGLCS